MMRPISVFCLALLAAACKQPPSSPPVLDDEPAEAAGTASAAELPPPVPARDVVDSVVRVNSTRQEWNAWQPWEKTPPNQRRALAAITGERRVLTTAEMVADATYLEFESPDGTRFCPAKVAVVDYEANLALLEPAPGTDADAFFEGTTPLEIAEPPALGEKLDIIQIEDNGLPLRTAGIVQSVDVSSSFLPEHSFLSYRVKASMQSAASSYSLPALRDDKFAGLLLSYNSKDQLCEVGGTEIVRRFLTDAADGNHEGFPSLGVAVARTEDPSFRSWLKLADDQGGLYVSSVRPNGAAEAAGLKKGDVLLEVDGMKIDRRGYYDHPVYGNLF
ncbi:MAG: PDZ domain-containing protein, partial [Verrucomicrobiae bacterium]|nr:PDZ domain-containing protein [Verrucomicrobiae bacterium]